MLVLFNCQDNIITVYLISRAIPQQMSQLEHYVNQKHHDAVNGLSTVMLTLPPTHSMKSRCSAVCLLLPQIIHILHCLLAYSLLNYTPDFAVNWIQVMAVRPPQIQCDECRAVGFTRILRMVSLQTLQIKIMVYDTD